MGEPSDRAVRSWWLAGFAGAILLVNGLLIIISGRAPASQGWLSAIVGAAFFALSASVLRGIAKVSAEEGPGKRPFDIGKRD